VAVLHLTRFGAGPDAPWVVVGTDEAWTQLWSGGLAAGDVPPDERTEDHGKE